MRLYHTGPSPYGRKVMVTAAECGFLQTLEVIQNNPHDSDPVLLAHNPLSKVPVLIRDDGVALYDSSVICEYFDSLRDGPSLFPSSGEMRWISKRRHALAQGIIDCSVARRVEGWRATEPDRVRHIERLIVNTGRALDAFEAEDLDSMGPLSIDQIALGCALGFIDFRFPGDDWRNGRPALAAWYAAFETRPSMQLTRPKDLP